MHITAKITSKGQITIPKAIRNRIQGRAVVFSVEEDGVITLRSVEDVAGSLAAYAQTYTPMDQVRESVWGEIKDE